MVINNELLAKLARTFCSWGYKLRLRNQLGEFDGNAAPLLINAHPYMLWVFAASNMFILFLNVILFVTSILFSAENDDDDDDDADFTNTYISAIIFSTANSKLYILHL